MVATVPGQSRQIRLGDSTASHDGYRHYQKRISPSLDFEADTVRLKWYDIHFTMRPIVPEIDVEAREFLAFEIGSGRLPVERDPGS